jgi:hypothetical protein
LTINKFEEWKKLKIEDIVKVLESFWYNNSSKLNK